MKTKFMSFEEKIAMLDSVQKKLRQVGNVLSYPALTEIEHALISIRLAKLHLSTEENKRCELLMSEKITENNGVN